MEENVVCKLSKRFALRIVNLYKILLIRKEYTMSKQLYRSGTSIGANLAESIFAQSEADYISKLKIALKEASESKYWIELLTESNYLSEEEYVPTVSKSVTFQSDGIAGEPANPVVLNYNPPLKGDANNNGKRESADIVEIVNAMTGQPSSAYKEKLADTKSDSIVNIADIIWIVNTIMATQ